jgi:hypothetical protein
MKLDLQYLFTTVGGKDFEFTVGVQNVESITIDDYNFLTVIKRGFSDQIELTTFKMITNIRLKDCAELTYIKLEDYKIKR